MVENSAHDKAPALTEDTGALSRHTNSCDTN